MRSSLQSSLQSHFTSTRTARTKKAGNNNRLWRCGQIGTLLFLEVIKMFQNYRVVMVAQSCKYSKTDWIVQFAKYIFAGQYVWSLSRVWLLATPWTVAHQAPLFVRFPRQEYWSGLPFHVKGSSWPRDRTCSSCHISFIGRQSLYRCAIGEAL